MSWDITTAQALPSTEVTHLHLLRHGQVDTGGRRLAYGHSDFPLTGEGERQGAALVDFAARQLPAPAGILSSDLRRCSEIARPLAARLGVPLRLEPALREQHMGEWEGVAWEDLTAREVSRVRAFWTDYATARPPGGESLADMAVRVSTWMAAEEAELRGRRWFVLTHIGVIRALCCEALGVSLDQALRFAPVHASHSWIQRAQAGSVLQTLGERPFGIGPGPAGEARAEVAPAEAGGRPPRIALSGSAGTGKSTLGRALAHRLEIPYLPEGMRDRIEAGLSLHALDHAELKALVQDLWAEQHAREEAAIREHGGFVADRSPVDFLAFWLHYRFTDDMAATERFFGDLLGRLPRYDRIVLLPWGVLPLLADGVRSSNPWLQRSYQATVEGLLQREVGAPRLAVMPALKELEARVEWTVDLLQQAGALARRG